MSTKETSNASDLVTQFIILKKSWFNRKQLQIRLANCMAFKVWFRVDKCGERRGKYSQIIESQLNTDSLLCYTLNLDNNLCIQYKGQCTS